MKVLARVLLGLGYVPADRGDSGGHLRAGSGQEDPARRRHDDRLRGRGGQDRPAHRSLRREARLRDPAHQGGLEDVSTTTHVILVETRLRGLRHRRRPGVRQRQRPRPDHREHRHLRDRPRHRRWRSTTRTCPPTRSRTRASSTSSRSTWRRRPTPSGTVTSAGPWTSTTRAPRPSSGSRPTSSPTPSRTSRSTSAEGIPGTYDNVVTVYVDPKTGSIVKSGQDQQRYLEDGTPVLDIQLIGTDDTVKKAVDEAKTAGRSLIILLDRPPDRRHRRRPPVPARRARAGPA